LNETDPVGGKAEVIEVAAYLLSKVELKSAVANLVPIRVVTVEEKLLSLLRAVASSFKVSKVEGAELTILAIWVSQYPFVHASVDKVGVANELIF